MTTIDAAVASRLGRRLAYAALTVFWAAGLGACSSGGSLFGGAAEGETGLPQQAAVQPAPTTSRVSIAPVIGAPDAVAKQITAQLGQELEQKRVGVARDATERSDYTLRGYIVAAKERTGIKVSYIWDLTDPTGKRVNRITSSSTRSS